MNHVRTIGVAGIERDFLLILITYELNNQACDIYANLLSIMSLVLTAFAKFYFPDHSLTVQ